MSRAIQARAERARLARNGVEIPAPDLGLRPAPWLHADASVEAQPYLAAADRIVQGKLDLFALRGVDMGSPPRWNRDPKTGIEAPLAFGKLLDYRDADVVGDIKYLWEPNRHLHLVTLAQAHALTGRKIYLETLQEHLDSWILACPYGYGPNWASSLEVALRLVNWSAAWQLLGGNHSKVFSSQEGISFRTRWLNSVYEHARFVGGWFSLHSSANNHLIGEAAGLFIAGLTWPYWREAADWVSASKHILEREALTQNAPDGVNREQAHWYQQFVLDMLVSCLLAGKANRQWFSADYESRIEAMMDFIASTMDCGGNVPMFGDADDGTLLRLAPDPGFSPWRSLLATGALLFRRGDFKLKSGGLDDKTRWLFGPQAQPQFDSLDAEKTRLPIRQTFPEGGYFVLGCDFETPGEIRLVADAGPLGYRSIAAHGHADALSFTLSLGGREIFVDPGTYAYHTQARWRDYFRGTAAHNTLRVDGFDQSVAGGNFMWMKHARAGCSLWLSSGRKDVFEGWHDGYMVFEDPVKHRRLIELDKRARRIVVEDSLEMEEDHEVELFFHCAEECTVQALSGTFFVSRQGETVRLRLPESESAAAQVYRGSVAPIAGWVAGVGDRRRPAPTIVWRARLLGTVVLRTEISVAALQ